MRFISQGDKGVSAIGILVILAITIAAFAIILLLAFKDAIFLSGKTNREIALMCTTEMATQFHIHPHLEILVDGQKQEIPADIGVEAKCMRSLHTHDNTGIIHVEAKVKKDFTLSDFFAVWNKHFDRNQILEYKADENHKIRITVNGNESQEYENLILQDKDEVVIHYETINNLIELEVKGK